MTAAQSVGRALRVGQTLSIFLRVLGLMRAITHLNLTQQLLVPAILALLTIHWLQVIAAITSPQHNRSRSRERHNASFALSSVNRTNADAATIIFVAPQ